MTDKWSQYEIKSPSKDKWAEYEITPAKPTTPVASPTPVSELGWFEPGSKSEAALRGFSQAATLGFGDEIQAALRADWDKNFLQNYSKLRDEERQANTAASEANPMSYFGGNIAGALPQGLMAARSAAMLPANSALWQRAAAAGATGAGFGAAQGLGASEKTSLPETIQDVAATSAMSSLANAAGPILSKAATAPFAARTFNKLRGQATPIPSIPKPVPDTIPTPSQSPTGIGGVAQQFANQFGIPTVSALGNVALNRYERASSGNQISNEDPWSNLIDESIQASIDATKGAAFGYGLQRSPKVIKAVGDLAANKIAGPISNTLPAVGKAIDKGLERASSGRVPGISGIVDKDTPGGIPTIKKGFNQLTDYLKSARGSTNMKVLQAAQLANLSTNDEKEQRRNAVKLQSTPEGRAVTNSESPVRDMDNDIIYGD